MVPPLLLHRLLATLWHVKRGRAYFCLVPSDRSGPLHSPSIIDTTNHGTDFLIHHKWPRTGQLKRGNYQLHRCARFFFFLCLYPGFMTELTPVHKRLDTGNISGIDLHVFI
ncbi:hypothetical protein F5Y04DRAFT_206494 [Hypomontagnella monticulosa]|nr:hypothetical protein F5Y04DRAFT_206494 [Hypomontagnella monticulosa]